MDLNIRVEEQDGVSVISLDGEIDAYTAPDLKEVLFPLAEDQRVSVCVDLSGVGYIDSTGLGIFIGALKATDANGGTFSLTGLSSRIKRLFSITGLDEVITIEDADKEELS